MVGGELLRIRAALGFLSALPLCVLGGLGPQIPSIASFTPSNGSFKLSPIVRIVVDTKFANHGSPSLLDFAKTFQKDLEEVVHFTTSPSVSESSVVPDHDSGHPTIFLTLNSSASYALYNGQPTNEGYQFEVTPGTYLISAPEPIGVWWGTRTLLQHAAVSLAQGAKTVSFPAGVGVDSPGWEIRGFMLDAGRHWFEASFLGMGYTLYAA